MKKFLLLFVILLVGVSLNAQNLITEKSSEIKKYMKENYGDDIIKTDKMIVAGSPALVFYLKDRNSAYFMNNNRCFCCIHTYDNLEYYSEIQKTLAETYKSQPDVKEDYKDAVEQSCFYEEYAGLDYRFRWFLVKYENNFQVAIDYEEK